MRIAIVVRSVHWQIPTYSTTHFAYEAAARGHTVIFTSFNQFNVAEPSTLTIGGHPCKAPGPLDRQEWLVQTQKSELLTYDLDSFDAIFLRFNPNVKDSFGEVERDLCLELCLKAKTLGVEVINDPEGLMRCHSKLYLTRLPEQTRVPSFISRSEHELKQFIQNSQGPVIVKPIRGSGGRDVFLISSARDKNASSVLANLCRQGYVVAQPYIRSKGDFRILLWKGKPIVVDDKAAIARRTPSNNDFRTNRHTGGSATACQLTPTLERLVEQIGPQLLEDGLYWVGVDVVGDKVLEINAFCPGSIEYLNELYNINIGRYLVTQIEEAGTHPALQYNVPENNVPQASLH